MKDLTLVTCSFNTPEMTKTMLQSWFYHNKKESKILVIENSTNEKTVNILEKHKIPFIRNYGGTHSPSVDIAIDKCKTKYMLLVDTDIIHEKPFYEIYDLLKSSEISLSGIQCGSRGGHFLHDRIHPWFMFVDLEQIKKHNIKFHDQERIDKTNSNGFYESIPLCEKNPNIKKYDVGSTFFEDIKNANLKIANTSIIQKWFTHYEGASWHKNVPVLKNLYDRNQKAYLCQIEKYKNVDISL